MDNLNDLIYQKGEAFPVEKQILVTKCLLCNEEIPVYSSYDNEAKVCECCKNTWIRLKEITAWIKLGESTEKLIQQETQDIKEKGIKEILEKLEQTEAGKLIAKGYKDYCLKKDDKV